MTPHLMGMAIRSTSSLTSGSSSSSFSASPFQESSHQNLDRTSEAFTKESSTAAGPKGHRMSSMMITEQFVLSRPPARLKRNRHTTSTIQTHPLAHTLAHTRPPVSPSNGERHSEMLLMPGDYFLTATSHLRAMHTEAGTRADDVNLWKGACERLHGIRTGRQSQQRTRTWSSNCPIGRPPLMRALRNMCRKSGAQRRGSQGYAQRFKHISQRRYLPHTACATYGESLIAYAVNALCACFAISPQVFCEYEVLRSTA